MLDPSGAAVPGAVMSVRLRATGWERRAVCDGQGRFHVGDLGPGDYSVTVVAPGFAESTRIVVLRPGEEAELVIPLQTATLRQEVFVYGNRIAAGAPETPGALTVLDPAALAESRPFNVDEVLRRVPGVFVRPNEEGFGLRPHIGIRGLNPTRSSKVLLLEDGIPLTYAPYGDNASYYHPPIDRFESIEVVKGAGQILYGPSTIGGVINYLTPAIPDRPAGELLLTGGNRDFLSGHLRYGRMRGRTGFLADVTRKQGEGSRENTRVGYSDFNLKVSTAWDADQLLTLRFNYYRERSQVTYSGLTEEEFRVNPRQNPFLYDRFTPDRIGASLSYAHSLSPSLAFTANLYGSHFNRDWWRQSSNSAQRPNRRGDPGCAGMADLLTSCGNEGRLRGYYSWGVEPRFRWAHRLLGFGNAADFGVRAHLEDQDRQQKNGPLPWSRDGRLVEDNKRRTQAYSAFWQNRLSRGRLGLTPGVRLEHVRYYRNNRLNGAVGRTALTELIPGLGVSFTQGELTLFAGVHRGFAPPRAEDIINNNGGTVDLDPELSWNYEVGGRWRAARRLSLEATAFRMDYENQIVPASVAGGIGATLTSAGRTLHQGLEWSSRWEMPPWFGARHNLSLRTAYTWLPVARFAGIRFSAVPGFARVSVRGNRLPYAPHHLFSGSLLYARSGGMNVLLEANVVSRQFGDDLNTIRPTPDGQRGLLPGHALWNATLNYPLEGRRATLFVTVKNLADRLVIVDRTRGILPSPPRLVQFGVRWRL
ncbi:MAG: TonB-dependent receptor [Bryobacterales bacterium]|nr:TonB-dependent receptor [Bryobacteraceae bacterium]MDW8355405.1 TonB-dependent receptor [Bryobacterales bacterium]